MRHVMIAVALTVVGAGLTGCVDDYGYGGVAVGYGYPGGYGGQGGGYYDAGYEGYGDSNYHNGAYGSPYWGWSGGFYYPGSGIYVYDQYRRPFRWNGSQQRYWQGRSNGWRGQRGGAEWRGFDQRSGYAGAAVRPAGVPSAAGRGYGFPGSGRQSGFEGSGRPTFQAPQGNRQTNFQGRRGGRQPEFQSEQGRRQSAPASGGHSGGGGHINGGHGRNGQ